jgi:hypothetical protein
MLDEETGAEPRAVSASIADPYLLVLRDDGSAFVAQIDNSNELEEVEKTDGPLTTMKWSSGCLYTDTKGIFQQSQGDKGKEVGEKVMMFLLNSSGALHASLIRTWHFKKNGRLIGTLRSSRYRISRSQCTLLRGYHTFPRSSQPTSRCAKGRRRNLCRRYWLQTSVTPSHRAPT